MHLSQLLSDSLQDEESAPPSKVIVALISREQIRSSKISATSSKELRELASLPANDGTRWLFNPPASPHFGGHWEAGVKSVKHH